MGGVVFGGLFGKRLDRFHGGDEVQPLIGLAAHLAGFERVSDWIKFVANKNS